MNLHVTHRAGLKLRALVVHRSIRRGWRVDIAGAGVWSHAQRVALETEDIDLVDLQQTRIARAVDLVTGLAALGFHWHMLKYERTLQAAVAFEADRVLCGL